MQKHTFNFPRTFNPDTSLPKLSISAIIGMITEPFDSEGVAQKTYNKHFSNPESQYYQMTVEQILESWAAKGQESLRYGRLNDEYIGLVLEGTEDEIELFKLDHDADGDERLGNQILSFNQFIENLPEHIKYVTREKTLYYKINNTVLNGRFDALFYDAARNKYIIVDWKTSGTVDTEGNQWTSNLLGPAKCFPNLNWYIYTIQVYFYKMALLQSGILPEVTSPDQIEVMIVNLPGRQFDDGKYYKEYYNAFEYDEDKLKGIFEFSIKKHNIINKNKNK